MTTWHLRPPLCLALLAFAVFGHAWAAEGILRDGPRVGGYRSLVYLPAGHDPATAAPLVVALHGCSQDSRDFAIGSAFQDLADREGFVLLYPETERPYVTYALNPKRCWLWWSAENQVRDQGEPRVILDLIEALKGEVAIDVARIYVTGLSSGGAMSAILGTLYPEVFAATGAHSGLQFAAASETPPPAYLWAFLYFDTWFNRPLAVMAEGGPDPDAQGDLAYERRGGGTGPAPLIVIHGSADETVDPVNAGQAVRQFAQLNDQADDGDGGNDSVDAVADRVEVFPADDARRSYLVESYDDALGREILRKVTVVDLGHAWSGGDPEGSYADQEGPAASLLFWEFFKRRTLGGRQGGP